MLDPRSILTLNRHAYHRLVAKNRSIQRHSLDFVHVSLRKSGTRHNQIVIIIMQTASFIVLAVHALPIDFWIEVQQNNDWSTVVKQVLFLLLLLLVQTKAYVEKFASDAQEALYIWYHT